MHDSLCVPPALFFQIRISAFFWTKFGQLAFFSPSKWLKYVCVYVFFVFVVASFQQFFLEKSPDFSTGVLACSQKYEGFLKLKNLSYLVCSQIWLNLLVDDASLATAKIEKKPLVPPI
jgi:hypothetical protein